MIRIAVISILIEFASIYQGKSVELLDSYKLWRSVSDQLAYDFSGNSRHTRLFSNFVFTDRGITPFYPSKIYRMIWPIRVNLDICISGKEL